jgi:hypothetical protein
VDVADGLHCVVHFLSVYYCTGAWVAQPVYRLGRLWAGRPGFSSSQGQ